MPGSLPHSRPLHFAKPYSQGLRGESVFKYHRFLTIPTCLNKDDDHPCFRKIFIFLGLSIGACGLPGDPARKKKRKQGAEIQGSSIFKNRIKHRPSSSSLSYCPIPHESGESDWKIS